MARFALLVLLLAAVCASSFQTTQAVDASFRVGIAGTVTGPFAAVFAASNVSFQMWADYVNGPSGGIPADGKKYGVEFVYRDVNNSAQGTTDACEALINEDKCDFLFSPYGSTLTPYAAAVGEKYGVPVIAGGSAAESVFMNLTTNRRRFEYLVSVNTPAKMYFDEFVDLVSIKGATTVAVLAEDATFPAATAAGAIEAALDRRLDVVAEVKVPRIQDTSDSSVAILTEALQQMRAANPDVLISSVYMQGCSGLIRAAKSLDYMPKAWALSVCIGSSAAEADLGMDLQYLYGPSQWDYRLTGRSYKESGATLVNYFDRNNVSAPEAFHNEYKRATGGTPPTYQVAAAMAQGYALEAAIKYANTIDADSVKQALAQLYESSFYGRISFGFNGLDILKPMVTYQYLANTEGEVGVQIVTPLSAATTNPVYPAPQWSERMYVRESFGTVQEVLLVALSGLLMLATAVVSIMFFVKRHSKIVRASNHWFCQLMFVAGEMTYASVIFWRRDATSTSCRVMPVLFTTGMMLFLACLVAKNYRIFKIVTQRTLRRVRIHVYQLILIVAAVCSVQLVLMAAWFLVGPPEAEVVKLDPHRPSQDYHHCVTSTTDSEPILLALIGYSCLVGSAAVLVAFLSRSAPSAYNESKTIALATYNTCIGGALFVGLNASPLSSEPSLRNTWFMMRGVLALVIFTGTLGAVFVPKVAWLLLEMRGVDIENRSRGGHDTHNGVSRGGKSRRKRDKTPNRAKPAAAKKVRSWRSKGTAKIPSDSSAAVDTQTRDNPIQAAGARV